MLLLGFRVEVGVVKGLLGFPPGLRRGAEVDTSTKRFLESILDRLGSRLLLALGKELSPQPTAMASALAANMRRHTVDLDHVHIVTPPLSGRSALE